VITFPRRNIEELINELRCWRDFPDAKGLLTQTLQRESERAYVGNLSRHKELERVLCAGGQAKIYETLVDDFRARLGSEIAPQVDVKLTSYLEVVGRPSVSHGVE
jgi:hypothetical protein